MARLAVPRLADWCSVDIADGQCRRATRGRARRPGEGPVRARARRRYPPDPRSTTGAPNVLRTGKSELYAEISKEMIERGARDAEHLRIIRELDLRSAIVVPLQGRERVFGAITLVYAASNRRYGAGRPRISPRSSRAARALIIERRKLEEEAALANRTKDEFLATMSHELRTPLQAILGWATMLRARRDARSGEAIEAIVRNATAQARLIDDILDVSRIISGKLRLSLARVDVAGVDPRGGRCRAAGRGGDARSRSPRTSPPDLGDLARRSGSRCSRSCGTSLSNAVKFTATGRPRRRARRAR